eukprot:CAMPEP_0172400138 /NCGR_PEP_ID=MMETSP1061-20121228/44380_1 /TAXON_ID=37318 /ORGANISM="Pseudo-nitzschia pungens, Strain cf. pungens" /LENGTH=96 /DNA_ID=CAMNT_0013133271 /DNA_START=174 /DNA_END=464 /DNA_ORIENTATION=+
MATATLTGLIPRVVRTMSLVHKTANAVRRRETTVDEVLRTTVFTPQNFPRVLAAGIWLTSLEFSGRLIMGTNGTGARGQQNETSYTYNSLSGHRHQ